MKRNVSPVMSAERNGKRNIFSKKAFAYKQEK